jgi:hypothetical protein
MTLVFESIIFNIYEVNLTGDELQVSFKRGSGCNDAIFALKTIIHCFAANKSTIFAAVLDVCKVFFTVFSTVKSLIRYTKLVILTM